MQEGPFCFWNRYTLGMTRELEDVSQFWEERCGVIVLCHRYLPSYLISLQRRTHLRLRYLLFLLTPMTIIYTIFYKEQTCKP